MVGTLSSTEELLERVFEHLSSAHRLMPAIPGVESSTQKKHWDERFNDAFQGTWGLAANARPASLSWLMTHRTGFVALIRKAVKAGFEVNQLVASSRTRSVVLVELIQAEACANRLEADLLRYDSYAALVDEHLQIIQEVATVKVLEPLALARDAYLATLSQATLEAYIAAVNNAFSDDRFYYLELPDELKRQMLARASTVFEQLTAGTLVYELVNGETDE